MLNSQDKENLIKACQTANLLAMDLKELTASQNILLSELVIDLHKKVLDVEQKLLRISNIT